MARKATGAAEVDILADEVKPVEVKMEKVKLKAANPTFISTIYLGNMSIDFINGTATVEAQVAKQLRDLGHIV